MTTLLCKRITVGNPKEWKPDAVWQKLLRKTIIQKLLF
jgi:hypothetical protein